MAAQGRETQKFGGVLKRQIEERAQGLQEEIRTLDNRVDKVEENIKFL